MQNFLSGHAIQCFSARLYEPVNILAVYPYGRTEPERNILRLGFVGQRISIAHTSFIKPCCIGLRVPGEASEANTAAVAIHRDHKGSISADRVQQNGTMLFANE